MGGAQGTRLQAGSDHGDLPVVLPARTRTQTFLPEGRFFMSKVVRRLGVVGVQVVAGRLGSVSVYSISRRSMRPGWPSHWPVSSPSSSPAESWRFWGMPGAGRGAGLFLRRAPMLRMTSSPEAFSPRSWARVARSSVTSSSRASRRTVWEPTAFSAVRRLASSCSRRVSLPWRAVKKGPMEAKSVFDAACVQMARILTMSSVTERSLVSRTTFNMGFGGLGVFSEGPGSSMWLVSG